LILKLPSGSDVTTAPPPTLSTNDSKVLLQLPPAITMDSVSGMFRQGQNQTAEQKKQALMQTIQQQQNIENARVLIEKINSNCFEKCVPKPGSSLSSGEKTCLTSCMQKYMNAWNAVSSAYILRIKNDPSSD